jgi:hypothetical protein
MTSSVSDLLRTLEAAALAERQAREATHEARKQVAQSVRELVGCGVPSVKLAARVSKTLGLPLNIGALRKFAARLRKRASRVNGGHGFLRGASGPSQGGAVPSTEEEVPMPTLVKKTTTTTVEEFIDETETNENEQLGDLEHDDVDEEADEDDEGADPETEPKKPRRRVR